MTTDPRPPLRLYNTLGRREEIFRPLHFPTVLMYTCGPTVYHYAHIGNMRAFLTADVLRRVLEYNGYSVVHVKNITDVGHLRDDVAETGPDRIEAAAQEAGATPSDLVDFYTCKFVEDERLLNILEPLFRPKATEYIPQMIDLIKILIKRGYAYEVNGSVYFTVSRFDSYGELSGNRLEDLVAGFRVGIGQDKRNPADFALWKAGDPARVMNWESPWGLGFPGWHIECSVMAAALLGDEIDLHTGGIDNLFPHHEDERAQSQAATGKPFVRYWVHTAHLLIADAKMSRSLGNFATVSDLVEQGIHPLAFRYFLLQGHYRKQMSWTPEALAAAHTGLERIWDMAADLFQQPPGDGAPTGGAFRARFVEAINDDLGTPRALAIVQEVLDSDVSPKARLELLSDMDRVLGLDILQEAQRRSELTPEQAALVCERRQARTARDWARSDSLRAELLDLGVEVRDVREGQRWIRRLPGNPSAKSGHDKRPAGAKG